MKSRVILFILMAVSGLNLSGAINNDSILIIIGDKEFTKSEFLRIYEKNNNNVYDPKTIEEYVDLFVNFKLKVIEAENRGMDTTKAFIEELSGYRQQLEEPYLTNEEFQDSLIKEAYERMEYELNVSHIVIRCSEQALPKDTLIAYNKAIEIRDRILNGEDFEKVVKATSDDPSAKQNAGNLGYFSVFQMAYPFESVAYKLEEPGEISMPVRSKFGYHIIKLNDKIPSRGKLKVAHIMKIVPQDAPEDTIQKKKEDIYSIWDLVKSGADFKKLAKLYSDDRGSAPKGGELPMFSGGRMVREFEEAAFALESIGDISNPIQTPYGYHIIKLLDKKKIGSFEEEKAGIQKAVNRGDRAKAKEDDLINDLKEYHHFYENENALRVFLGKLDTALMEETLANLAISDELNDILFSFADTAFFQQDYLRFLLNKYEEGRRGDKLQLAFAYYSDFVSEKLKEYERKHLEYRYDDFKYLMQEYHDGILLFEITDKMVWSKAVKDTVGLEKYYEENKTNYNWGERVKAAIFSTTDKEIAEEAKVLVKKSLSKSKISNKDVVEEFKQDSVTPLKMSEGTFAKGWNSLLDNMEWEVGVSPVIEENNKFYIVKIEEVLEPQPKSLNAARGLVIADYQNYLEKLWIEELRQKYPIEINKSLLKTLIEEQ
ncbi:peptidylprolyl isomerase [Bacteroidota bacterium]